MHIELQEYLPFHLSGHLIKHYLSEKYLRAYRLGTITSWLVPAGMSGMAGPAAA
jgi:hypothetical protein